MESSTAVNGIKAALYSTTFATTCIIECDDSRKMHRCDVCGTRFERRSNLKAHHMTHTGEKPHKCPHCNLSFSRKYNMQKHILVHTGEKPYKCTCGMSFTRKNYLAVHTKYQLKKTLKAGPQITHQQVVAAAVGSPSVKLSTPLQQSKNPFHCVICFKSFTRKNNLKQHMAGHSDSRPFQCIECNRRFAKKANLKSHMLTHSGVKPHLCPICHVGFSRKSNLTKHILIHQREKPYRCTECGRTFTQKKNLNSHGLIHMRNTVHKCENCGKCFSRRDSLLRHKNLYAVDEIENKHSIDCLSQKENFKFHKEVNEVNKSDYEGEICHSAPDTK